MVVSPDVSQGLTDKMPKAKKPSKFAGKNTKPMPPTNGGADLVEKAPKGTVNNDGPFTRLIKKFKG